MKAGRNDPCPCGSGQKYKKCCLSKDEDSRPAEVLSVAELTPEQRKALADVESDAGKQLHGSLQDPILNPGETGDSPVNAPYIRWEYDHMMEVIGPYRRLAQALMFNSKKHPVDRLVGVDKQGITHVFYFDIHKQFFTMGETLAAAVKAAGLETE